MIEFTRKSDWENAQSDKPHSPWLRPSRETRRDSPWVPARFKFYVRVPQENRLIDQAIDRSGFILEIHEFDGELISYSADTLKRAVAYLRRMALLADIKSYDLPVPRIVPADEGSIDLLWKEQDRSLLINFPADADKATFAGRKKDIQTSGVLLTDDAREELIRWLCV